MDWDECYKKEKDFGKFVKPQVKELLKYKTEGNVLDIGCGQGRDLLFLNENGFSGIGIDPSRTAVELAEEEIKKRRIKNIRCVKKSIESYRIGKNWGIVMCNYVLHLFVRKLGLGIIKKMQTGTKKGGLNLISGFMAEPPFYGEEVKDQCYFKPHELLELYAAWKVLFYQERMTEVMKKDSFGRNVKQKEVILIAQK